MRTVLTIITLGFYKGQNKKSIEVSGTIVDDRRSFVDKATISVIGFPGLETTDNVGYFNLELNHNMSESLRIHISKDGYENYEQIFRLPLTKPLYIVLKKVGH
jgi:hypothetical protein